MKRIKLILCGVVGLLFGFACSDSTVPELASEPWNVTISRAGGETVDEAYGRILILGKKESDTKLVGVFNLNGGSGGWENPIPVWPQENNEDMSLNLYAVLPVPDNNELPTEVDLSDGQGTTWQVDYHAGQVKPNSLTLNMTHILAKLVVHIRIDGEVNPEPTAALIRLKAKGTVNYSSKYVDTDMEQFEVPLGTFHQEGQKDHSTEHNWETENAIVVIPQTIPAGEPCLWFTAGGKEYTFTPQTNLNLEVGKVNNLHLGVTIGGPVFLEGISVADWNTGGHLGDYELEE